MEKKLFNYRASELILKEMRGELSEDEQKELSVWRVASAANGRLYKEFQDEDLLSEDIGEFDGLKARLESKIFSQIGEGEVFKMRRNPLWKLLAAAVILGVLIGGYFMFFDKQRVDTPPIVQVKDIEAPKMSKARIILPDGKEISIDSLTSYQQGNVKVTKTADGRIIYTGVGQEVVFNTLTNPRGSKVIDMTLTDGSHVWLNAGSSVTYPVAFVGTERKVSISGEAYFEVAHNSTMPFVVSKGDVQVQVLGTHFNVNAYDDESDIKVTLLEGSVKVLRFAQDDKTVVVLKPGQQAVLRSFGSSQDDKISVVNNVDIEQVMAWKNGTFYFSNTNIEVIMRQAARWYDVDVTYEGNVKTEFFGGTVSRTENISQLIKALELTKTIKISVEGKKLIIRPAK